MKKIKTNLLAFLLLPCCLLAQIPNADFEQWVPDDPPSYDQEYPQSWSPPPLLGHQHYPVEKVSNPNRGEYAMKVKNNLPTPSAVGGASWPMDVLFSPSSQHFRLSTEVRIFPNPATEAVWVKTETGEFIQAINIFNSKGEVVLRANPNKNEYLLDVKALPAGAYWMEIVLPGKRLIRQWAKG